jgi:hypothetical protein
MLTEVQEDLEHSHRGPKGSINAQNLPSQIIPKMASMHRAHRHLSNGANDKSNGVRMQKL